MPIFILNRRDNRALILLSELKKGGAPKVTHRNEQNGARPHFKKKTT
jgi:hypothetical protein